MKISKREKIMLIFMGIALLGFLYYWFIFKHENSTISKLNLEYNDKQLLLQKGKSVDSRLKAIDDQINELQANIDLKKNKIYEPIRVPEVLAELNSVAAQKSVKIDKIGFSGDAAIKGEFISANQGSVVNVDSTAAVAQPNDQSTPKVNNGTSTLTITIEIKGSYENCINLLKYYENNKKLYIVKDMEIASDGTTCNGTVTFEMISTASDDSAFLYNSAIGTGRVSPIK